MDRGRIWIMKSGAKVHFVYEERQCNCGDSFCGECREWRAKAACPTMGPLHVGHNATSDVRKVTCGRCCRSKVFNDALAREHRAVTSGQPAELDSLRDENKRLKAELLRHVIKSTIVGNFICTVCGAGRDRDIDMPGAHRETCFFYVKK